MTGRDLSSISARKYNAWCERRALVCTDKDRFRHATAFFARRDLAPSERAAFYLHELTGCEGLEFVAFSNARLKNPVMLTNDVVLMPCFLSESEMEGQNFQDPLVQRTMEMARQNRFIYDGWIPIETWDEENVRKAIRSVDEALSIFCLSGRVYFEWEPKYPAPDDSKSSYSYEDQHLQELEGVAKLLDSLGEGDRVALYRSLAWLSQSLRLNEPAARFLFSILAIESLARYIEEEASDESPLVALRADRLTRTEKRVRREQCISDILSTWLQRDPTKAIDKAYSDCMGIKRRLKIHLEHVFTSDPEPISLLFEQKGEGKSLFDLRHVIAHGTVDALSEAQRDQIRQRVWDAERVARRYISAVVNMALGAGPISKTMTGTMFIGIQNAVVSREGMYRGPTHMAVVYSYNTGSAIRFAKRRGREVVLGERKGDFMDYRRMTAPCGLDCFNCPMYLANENEGLRMAISKNMGFPFEKAMCNGCRNEKGTIPFLNMTEPCHVYKCTDKKGIDFCCDCSDFPCDYLHPYADMASQVPHNTKVFNLCLIKRMGLESWAETKAKSVKDTYFKGKFKL